MHFRVRLKGGTFKVKTPGYLRWAERTGKVPMVRLAGLCFIWWPNDIDEDGRKVEP